MRTFFCSHTCTCWSCYGFASASMQKGARRKTASSPRSQIWRGRTVSGHAAVFADNTKLA
jgi:hypothetical protein